LVIIFSIVKLGGVKIRGGINLEQGGKVITKRTGIFSQIRLQSDQKGYL